MEEKRDKNKYYGFYRARVVEVDIKEDNVRNKYGGVRVFIPDFFINEIDKTDEFKNGVIAYPANNFLGGISEEDDEATSHYCGSVFIPKKNSYVWIFFEGGFLDRPYYFAPIQFGFDPNSTNNPPSLPPENLFTEEPHKNYTLIKTTDGRSIVVSDSSDVARVQLTGKKHMISEPPSGDKNSVYQIQNNQNTILIDERPNSERILIKTRNGDFISINVPLRMLSVDFLGPITVKTENKLTLQSGVGIDILSGGYINMMSPFVNILGKSMTNVASGALLNLKCVGPVNIDGIILNQQMGVGLWPPPAVPFPTKFGEDPIPPSSTE